MENISLIIPIYNEEFNIESLFEEILTTKVYDIVNNIIFVDDCSQDQSLKLLKKIKRNYDKVHVISHNLNCGQSECLKSAANYSSDKFIITMDGDGQNNPKDIPKLLDKFFFNKDIYLVGGIRNKRKDNFIKIVTSKIANKIRMFILNDGCIDTGCSLKVFDKDVFLNFPFFDGIHRFLPALFKGYGLQTFFIKVDHRRRVYGKSKYGTFTRMFKGISDLIKVVIIIKNFKRDNA